MDKKSNVPDFEGDFKEKMISWFLEQNYYVGIPKEDFSEQLSIKLQREWAKWLSELADISWIEPVVVTGKPARSQEIGNAILPAIQQSNILGYQTGLICQLIPVLYVDSLSASEIVNRLQIYFSAGKQLRKTGERIFLLKRQVLVSPLLIFFNHHDYQSRSEALLPYLSEMKILEQAYLVSGLVNVHQQTVHYPDSSFFSLSKTSTELANLGERRHKATRWVKNLGGLVIFDTHDLQEILQ